jgi:ABC-2 type transport system ATP-binding protein
MSHAIETQRLTWRAGRGDGAFALDDVNLRVPRGAMYGFLGPNGAGKSTTIKLLVGLLRPAGGQVRVLDHLMPREAPNALARIGYVPERPHLYPSLTVAEAMRYHAAFHRRWDHRWAEELAKQLGLDGSRRIARLSKGETGKLLMLLALAQRPDLLVLDEPTDGLDPVVRREVMMALIEYVAEHDATVFISSHLVHELERICNWVGVMDKGRLVAELPMDSFKSGIKRLRVRQAPPNPGDTPFVVLAREASDALSASEVWVVRGWQPAMRQWFEGSGATLHEVVDLDLEEGYVELLRTFRIPAT